jgi:UDP-N-acetylmuramoyl-tripeptide--D-alanyl-D-alanine ligase
MIAAAARRTAFPADQIFEFEDSSQVIEFLQNHLRDGDIVLVKGSRGMRMDRIVASLEARS